MGEHKFKKCVNLKMSNGCFSNEHDAPKTAHQSNSKNAAKFSIGQHHAGNSVIVKILVF